MKRLMSVKNLENRAMRNIRNYEGNRPGFQSLETGRNYNGASAVQAFGGLSYTMTVKNVGTSAEDQTIALLPAYFAAAANIKDAAGAAVDAIIKEGTVIATADKVVTANGKPKSIDEFLLFIKNNPCRITGLKIKVDDNSQFAEDILFRKESPFRDLGFKTVSPSNYENSMQNNDKIVEIPLTDAQFDNQTSVVTTIKAGRTVTYTFFIGPIRNEAALLDQDVKLAGMR